MLPPTTLPSTSEIEKPTAMNPAVQTMFDLISRQGFLTMGATNMVFDNHNCRLSWRMGAGAKCTGVVLTYQECWGAYQLEFITSRSRRRSPKRNVFKRMYVEDVRPLIELETGFCLRLY